jgi:hypothetical protein
MENDELIAVAIKEIENPTFGVVKQFLEVHAIAYHRREAGNSWCKAKWLRKGGYRLFLSKRREVSFRSLLGY